MAAICLLREALNPAQTQCTMTALGLTPSPLSADILYEWLPGKNAQWAIRPRRERRGQQKVLKLSGWERYGSWRPFIQIATYSGLEQLHFLKVMLI